MASSLAEKIQHNFLQCGICLESFQNPCALPCLHSFCEACLERWYKTNKKKNPSVLICPNCANPAEIPSEGIKGFPAHFLVNSLQETVNMEKAIEDYSDKLCTKCNTVEKKANVYCQDCKHFLCGTCLDLHKTWESMKHHVVVAVDDLTSGKVTLSDLDQQDQNCAEHDDEQKRFYCETCDKPVCRDCIVMKQHCRDHDYITLKHATDKYVSHLKESIETCREKKEECQDAFKKTKLIKKDLSKAVTKVKHVLAIKKIAYHQEIDNIFRVHESEISDLHKERNAKLTEDTDNLKTVMNQIDSTLELGLNLTGSGSPYDIVSNYRSVLSRIQKVNDIEVNKVDETLADIPIPVVECVLGKQWEQTGKFQVPCKSLNGLAGIAASSDGNIALCERCCDNVHVYSRSGDFKHTFTITGGLGFFGDVAITPSNVYVIPTKSKCCQLYNSQYKLISEFQTCDANNQPSVAKAVTVDKDGCIILGMADNAISIHNTDGSVKSRFAIPYRPWSVAVTSNQEIVVATSNDTLQLLDYFGKSILTFDPPLEVNTWKPRHVCCSKRDEVFVATKSDPRGIYKYTAGGVYMGCITTQVRFLKGIALSHDDKELFVTETYRNSNNIIQEIKIFQRP